MYYLVEEEEAVSSLQSSQLDTTQSVPMILLAPGLTRRQRGGNPSRLVAESGTRHCIKDRLADDIPPQRRSLEALMHGSGYVGLIWGKMGKLFFFFSASSSILFILYFPLSVGGGSGGVGWGGVGETGVPSVL